MRLLVSACLLGVGCRYDGQSNQLPQLEQLLKQHTCIPVCAELFGGLPTPRVPAERQGNRVVTRVKYIVDIVKINCLCLTGLRRCLCIGFPVHYGINQ